MDSDAYAPGSQDNPSMGSTLKIHKDSSQHYSPFLSLPPELRNKIYRFALADTTIHIDYTDKSNESEHPDKLSFTACTSGSSLRALARLIGPAHDQSKLMEPRPCDIHSDLSSSAHCGDPLRLGVQLLRVCRQIHDEAALIPYSENYFIIGMGLPLRLRKAFLEQFTLEKRTAIRTAAILNVRWFEFELIPFYLPGLEHLWIEAVYAQLFLCHPLAKNNIEKKEKIDLPNLLGVEIWQEWSGVDLEDSLQKLEVALLKRKNSKRIS